MKDFLGNELQVGDVVVATELRYRNFIKCTIVAFTAQKVRLRPLKHRHQLPDSTDPNVGTFLQTPDQIIFVFR